MKTTFQKNLFLNLSHLNSVNQSDCIDILQKTSPKLYYCLTCEWSWYLQVGSKSVWYVKSCITDTRSTTSPVSFTRELLSLQFFDSLVNMLALPLVKILANSLVNMLGRSLVNILVESLVNIMVTSLVNMLTKPLVTILSEH